MRKLWFFSGQAGKDQSPPSFIFLSKKGKRKDRVRIEISDKDSSVLVLWGCRDSWDRVCYDVDIKDNVQHLGLFSEAICLKAKSDFDALMWCTQLQHALDETDGHLNIKECTVAGLGVDNDLLAAIDDQITVTECRHASLENGPVQGLRTLRGILSNRFVSCVNFVFFLNLCLILIQFTASLVSNFSSCSLAGPLAATATV